MDAKKVNEPMPLEVGQVVSNKISKQKYEIITIGNNRVMLRGLTGAISQGRYYPMSYKEMIRDYE